MVVLGLDPGSRYFGWGVVARKGTHLLHQAHGVIRTPKEGDFAERLVHIESALSAVIKRYQPSCASVESIFFSKNAQSAAKLGHARGVGLLVCARASIPIAEYPPAFVKRTITTKGDAEKEQVAHMIKAFLGLSEAPAFDASDALAVAITHLQNTLFNLQPEPDLQNMFSTHSNAAIEKKSTRARWPQRS
ncbi:crossover junction endodeoxyribonuclease RuvC [Pajaroellobacter abortibovis]|uniref:crossover junction endodeoxyribonuclease RuvC n=1 Tax=Pajaroellobacter abortibovis TaxID=1882918 RepID=UPI0009F989EB|nr:crossover junction endodeoxyribonuclease RuvC [Pajaroellobacter abortibovis]